MVNATKKVRTKKKLDIKYISTIPFILIHLSVFAVFWSGITMAAIYLFFGLFFMRIWSCTAGYHRYFSHKSFKTSRVFQFILAFLAQTSGQQGVIWWANHHRHHHKYSDTDKDPHSPFYLGFWGCHIGWVFARGNESRDVSKYTMVNDWIKYPELVWLEKHHYVPTVLLGILAWVVAGWPGLVVGFFMSTVCVYHSTFFINSITHIFGKQRYLTGDDSRNHLGLALLTFGEGWHNNHHYYQLSARMGFRWHEIDITYYSLKLLEKLGIVWELRLPTAAMIEGTNKIPQKIVTQSKAMLENPDLDLGGLADQLSQSSTMLGHLLEQPKQYIDNTAKGLKTNLEQIKSSIVDKAHNLDLRLPLILADTVKDKFKQAIATIEQAVYAVNSREKLKEAADALASASLSLGADHLIDHVHTKAS